VTEVKGKIYDIQGFSVHDGPGIRLTVFFKGCPLRCLWCHSPESQKFPTELNRMEIKCKGIEACGRCMSACPKGAILPGNQKKSMLRNNEITVVKVDRSLCDNCGICAKVCPEKALYLCGVDYSVEEIMQKVLRDKPFFESSGGGITVSGGECLCQPEFLLELLKACKGEGIHTAVDTTGFADWSVINPILSFADLFLYDLKHMDSEKHKLGTGVPNEKILENARKIAKAGGKFQIRIPIIPLYNDSAADFDAYGEFIVSLGNAVEIVQLLPYHSLGAIKWERLDSDAPVPVAEPPTEESVKGKKIKLEALGLKVTIH
jgi:pyruvate formate lyase activating enzyme